MLAAAPAEDPVRILETAPLRFEPSAAGGPAQFVARGPQFQFAFTAREAFLQSGEKNIGLRFQGASLHARLEALEKLNSTTHLYLGNDPALWRTAIPNYGRLHVSNLYPGIDLVYYGNAGQLEYDLTVRPGADPVQIRLRLEGESARVDGKGDLIAGLIQKHPVAFQIAEDGSRIPVPSRYRKNADGSYGFALGRYNHARELVIDPVLTLSLYLAGSVQDIAQTIGHDAKGFLYVAGTTLSTDFPIKGTALQKTNGGTRDLFLAKIDPKAKTLLDSTYLGGTADETLGGMTIGPHGDIYLTGSTKSGNFPTHNAAFSSLSGSTNADAFVVWIDSTLGLAYSTYLGGADNDFGGGITVDSAGKIFVTGGTDSDDFPTKNGFQTHRAGLQDAFVAMIDPSLSGSATLVYSSYLGGSLWDIGRSIAVAPDGTVWVAGGTYSHNFPMKGDSYQTASHNFGDAFLAHVNPAAGSNALEYSTYLGGAGIDEARSVVIDAAGQVIVSGWTSSTDFPVTADAMQPQYGGNMDAFVSILDASKPRAGQIVYSTYFGGSGPDLPFDLKQDSAGNLYLAGFTLSGDLIATPNAAQAKYDGSLDAFALRFTPMVGGPAAITYLTYLGSDGLQVAYGVDFDASGDIFLTGYTTGPLFKPFGGAQKSSGVGSTDAFVVGLNAGTHK